MAFLSPDGARFRGPVGASHLYRLCVPSELEERQRQSPSFRPAEMSMNGAVPILSDFDLMIPISKTAKKRNSNCWSKL